MQETNETETSLQRRMHMPQELRITPRLVRMSPYHFRKSILHKFLKWVLETHP